MSVRSVAQAGLSGVGKRPALTSAYDRSSFPGSFELISRVEVGAGGASSIEFTSIPGTFTHLQIRMIGRTKRPAINDAAKVQFNSDTSTNYSFHLLLGNGASTVADSATGATGISLYRLTGDTATTGMFGAFVCDILDYASTAKNTTVRSLGGADLNGATGGEAHVNSGLWLSTSAVTSIKLTGGATGADFAQYSRASLYGVIRNG